MIPKLYLIRSEERTGLTKIGVTSTAIGAEGGTEVVERIRGYFTGMSDSATVVEMPGAPIFEKWLHQFFSDTRKSISIRFILHPRDSFSPREWFELQPDVADILANTFLAAPPKTINDVSIDDLPLFLSGAAAIIRWHAEKESPEALAALAAVVDAESLLALVGNVASSPIHSDDVGYSLRRYLSLPSREEALTTATTLPSENTNNHLVEAITEMAKLRQENTDMQEIEVLRNYIAVATFLLILVTWAFGSSSTAAFLALLGIGLFVVWPNVLPRVATRFVRWLQRDAAYARETGSGG
ncbi:MAG: GIY-YIG nuclease family protein [Candidatus Promineofilum sp.]|jgi:hypothetical protein|nr:GIY-YIG nuclease family protein [Promineifilum sp.]